MSSLSDAVDILDKYQIKYELGFSESRPVALTPAQRVKAERENSIIRQLDNGRCVVEVTVITPGLPDNVRWYKPVWEYYSYSGASINGDGTAGGAERLGKAYGTLRREEELIRLRAALAASQAEQAAAEEEKVGLEANISALAGEVKEATGVEASVLIEHLELLNTYDGRRHSHELVQGQIRRAINSQRILQVQLDECEG